MKLELKNLLLIVFLQTIALSSHSAPKIIIEDVLTGSQMSYVQCNPGNTITTNTAQLVSSACNSGFEKKYTIDYGNGNLQVIGSCDTWRLGRNPWETIEVSGSIYSIKNSSGFVVVSFNITENGNNINISKTNGSTITVTEETCQIKVFLKASVLLNQGQVINGQWIMNDDLRTNDMIPLTDPYKTSALIGHFSPQNNPNLATTTAQVLAVSGNNAIVDWVFIQLDGINGTYTRAALLQRDGDIVDVNGTSPVAFLFAPVGYYSVTIRHRNHVQLQTLDDLLLNNVADNFNFTNNSIPLVGSSPTTLLSTNIYGMYGGDTNFDNKINQKDYDNWESQNGNWGDYFLNEDFNMDGSVDALDAIIWENNHN